MHFLLLLLRNLVILLLGDLHLDPLVVFLGHLSLGLGQLVPLLDKLADLLGVPWRHLLFEFDEVKHLLQDGLPLQGVLVRIQDQIKMERQVLVHSR